MKNRALIYLFFLSLITLFFFAGKEIALQSFREGDIVFMKDNSAQGKAVKLATHSEYSHVGIVLSFNNELYLYEAVQPVRRIKLDKWLSYADANNYKVKRLKADRGNLSAEQLEKMRGQAIRHLGKNYDPWFGWSDERMYCSEYVWKIYTLGAKLQLCLPKKMEDYDLSHPMVIKIMKQRYKEIPLKETMVAPADLFNSDQLELVKN